MARVMLAVAAVLIALVGGVALWLAAGDRTGSPASPGSSNSVAIGGASIGGPFELTDHTGRRVTAAEVIDGPALVYFGYTWCPDVCPVDVAIIAEAVELLDARGIAVKPVFITIDPARDDPESLRVFVEAMHPRMVGLTGSDADIATAAEAYKVYYEKAGDPAAAEDYLMSHTTFTYLMTPDGLAALFRRGASAEEIADETARALGL